MCEWGSWDGLRLPCLPAGQSVVREEWCCGAAGAAMFVVGDRMLLRELCASSQQRGSPAATAVDPAVCGVHPAAAERGSVASASRRTGHTP